MTSTDDPIADLDASLSGVARALFAAGSVTATLQAVVDLATESVEGCDFAGIFLLDGDQVTASVHTDPVVTEVDALQQQAGEGPCLDAITDGGAVYAEDLGDDPRWPRFGPEAAAAGMRSLFAVRLFAADTNLGALNLYARWPQAFGITDRAKALIFATLAGLALASARSHEDDDRRAVNLFHALDTREVIGQAQGILMERERIRADQAFDILRRASQHLNVKLREVAERVVHTGERPPTGPVRP